ncbi:MAG TPA: ATP-binding protein, partial [Sphingopyxis terrae]|nr:ATP-binding protein [Sphingopyxis terrae]
HEIGQPVAATRVFAENGQKMLAAGEVEQASGNFARIVDLADRIGRITGELRRFSRRQPADRREMPLGEAIDGALLLLRDRIRSMHVAIDLPPEEATQVVVAAEHVRLEQVLVNLLQNALDAAGEGGRVTVAVDAGGDAVCLRVIDSGTPLSLAQADDLFRPFATTKPDGLGLGLVIARDIMRDLGGELAYDADASATTFVMTIPRA